MKNIWRKQDKKIYLPKTEPEVIYLDEMNYVTVTGYGNPDGEMFHNSIQALYSISYGIKMTLKKENDFQDYEDYTVFPLEGLWSLTPEGIKLIKSGEKIVDIKDHFAFKLMIRQPDFITEAYFDKIKEIAISKKPMEKLKMTKFEKITEGYVCQMMHIGSFDNEPKSFEKMEEFCKNQNYKRLCKTHKEIYISDPRKVEESKLKTTLRFRISKKD